MQAKKNKTIKPEDLFTLGFSRKSAIVAATSSDEWEWEPGINGNPSIVYVLYTKRDRKGKETIERLPMAFVSNPHQDGINVDHFAENWATMGYTGGDRDKAKQSLLNFIKRELKEMGVALAVSRGYLSHDSTVRSFAEKFHHAGYSEGSGSEYVSAVFSPQGVLLGSKLTSYYDMPRLQASIESVAVSDQTIEVTAVEPAQSESTDNQADLETMTKAELIQMTFDLGMIAKESTSIADLKAMIRKAK